MTTEASTPREHLDLADWRRRIADLYAAVRSEAAHHPEAAWWLWRETREALFQSHSQSPVPASERTTFEASHWPYDARLRFEVALEASDSSGEADPVSGGDSPGDDSLTGFTLAEPLIGGLTLALPISTGGEQTFTRIGRLEVPFPAGTRTIGLYWMAGYAGGLFLAFRDATNGRETYGAGRYLLDTAKGADLGSGAAPDSLIPRLQLRVPPVMRVRPALVVSALAAREPPGHPHRGRRATGLTGLPRMAWPPVGCRVDVTVSAGFSPG